MCERREEERIPILVCELVGPEDWPLDGAPVSPSCHWGGL